MTELVLGKGLLVPPSKEGAVRIVQICEPSEVSKIQQQGVVRKTKSLQASYVDRVQPGEKDACEPACQSKIDHCIAKVQTSSHQVANTHKLDLATSIWVSPSTALALNAAASTCAQTNTTNEETTTAAVSPSTALALNVAASTCANISAAVEVVEPEEEPVVEDDLELDTTTSVGKSVALMLGKPISMHKNIFDLMADTASKMMKRTFGKQNASSNMQAELIEATAPIISIAAEPEPVAIDNDPPKVAEEKQQHVASMLPSIPRVKAVEALQRERRSQIPPPVLHNQDIKAAFQLKVMKMGAGRFSFDDIEAKTQDQLIEDLRRAGDKTNLKELQKESEVKLREMLKDRQSIAQHEMKTRHDGGAPFWRVEQILNRRAPEARSPSPETLKKWRAAAKKAGVHIEALTKEPLLNPWTSGNHGVSFSNVVSQETSCKLADSGAADAAAHTSASKVVEEYRSRPAPESVPRIVNPHHMELLLKQSPPKPAARPPITVSVPLPSRLAKGEILWRKLCPLN